MKNTCQQEEEQCLDDVNAHVDVNSDAGKSADEHGHFKPAHEHGPNVNVIDIRKPMYSRTPKSGVRISSQTRYPDIKSPDIKSPDIEACVKISVIRLLNYDKLETFC